MKGTTVEQSDLIGEIKDFPIEVVQEMVNEQVMQGNNADVGVFTKNVGASKNNGGFDWCYAIMGFNFWDNVIYLQNTIYQSQLSSIIKNSIKSLKDILDSRIKQIMTLYLLRIVRKMIKKLY